MYRSRFRENASIPRIARDPGERGISVEVKLVVHVAPWGERREPVVGARRVASRGERHAETDRLVFSELRRINETLRSRGKAPSGGTVPPHCGKPGFVSDQQHAFRTPCNSLKWDQVLFDERQIAEL